MMTQYKFAFAGLILALLAACSPEAKNRKISSADVSVEFDRQLHARIRWKQAGAASLVAYDTTVQPGIVVNGRTCLKFDKDVGVVREGKETDPEFGTGLWMVIKGIFEEGDLKI